jgi:antitoxin (DNA-binding transcriptional repressor) of toxin-antitoxin stability system
MKTEIGAYEATTHLPELLRQVKAGKRFTITHRGEAIADLVPAEAARPTNAAAAIERFHAFMRQKPVAVPNASVRELISRSELYCRALREMLSRTGPAPGARLNLIQGAWHRGWRPRVYVLFKWDLMREWS